MSFAQTHASLLNSPKFKKLSMAARGLWLTCQSWCAGQLTDGLIPESAVKGNGGSDAQIRALVKVGLWDEASTETGEPAYQFHDWLDHNESAEKISTKKRKERERKAAQRAKKSDPDSTQTSGKTGGSFRSENPSDQQESESVPGGKEREQKETQRNTPKCETARPPGGAHTEPETETRDGNIPTPSPSDSASAPDNSASSSRNQEPVVDMSATRKEPSIASLGKRMGREGPNDFEPGSLDHLPYEERKKFILDMAAQRMKEQSA